MVAINNEILHEPKKGRPSKNEQREKDKRLKQFQKKTRKQKK